MAKITNKNNFYKLLTLLLTLILLLMIYIYFTNPNIITIDPNIKYIKTIDSLDNSNTYYASMYDSIKKVNLTINNDIFHRDSIIKENKVLITNLETKLKNKYNEVDNNSSVVNNELLHGIYSDGN